MPSGSIVDDLPGADPTMMLTAQESIFVGHFVESRNHFAAYRTAFPDRGDESNSTMYRRACEVLRRPHILAAVQLLRDQMNADTLVRATDMLRDLVDIANANPNDLIRLEKYNCRHCHGVDHAWQWRDANELARSMDNYTASIGKKPKKGEAPLRMPDPTGGFGFKVKGQPHEDCPACLGEGHARITPMDTTKLSPQARKLFKGIKEKGDGSIEILMHDQMEARDMIIKMLGAYKDPKQATPLQPHEITAIPADATVEQAQLEYLKLVKGN